MSKLMCRLPADYFTTSVDKLLYWIMHSFMDCVNLAGAGIAPVRREPYPNLVRANCLGNCVHHLKQPSLFEDCATLQSVNLKAHSQLNVLHIEVEQCLNL